MYKVFSLLFAILPIALVGSIFSEKSSFWYKSGSVIFLLILFSSYVLFIVSFLFKGVLQLRKDKWIFKLVTNVKKKIPKISLPTYLLAGLTKVLLASFVIFLAFFAAFWTVIWSIENIYSEEFGFIYDALVNSRKISSGLGKTNLKLDSVSKDLEELRSRMFEKEYSDFFDNNELVLSYTINDRKYQLTYLSSTPQDTGFASNMHYSIRICTGYENGYSYCSFPQYTEPSKSSETPVIRFDINEVIENFYVDEYYVGNFQSPVSVFRVETNKSEYAVVAYQIYDYINQYFSVILGAEADVIDVQIAESTGKSLRLGVYEYVYDTLGNLNDADSYSVLFDYSMNDDGSMHAELEYVYR